jgi:alpha-tubulin suppressor-like RCC1 family protein
MQILIGISFIFSVTSSSFADWKENAKAIDISGGEDHTLVLTENMLPWACGDNYWRQLGTGASDDRLTLIEVHGKHNVGYLKEIDDVEAGWKHSLALDVNDMVWAWGNNEQGQLGDAQESSPYYSATPIMVHDGEMNTGSGYLEYIIGSSAGRSGLHSLAVDANGYAYAWGYNKYGQCGNDANECDELTPVYVHQGEQPDDPNDANDWLKHIVDISAGSNNSIALEADLSADPNSVFEGCVYTWGCNMWGEEPLDTMITDGRGLLGNGSDVNFSDTPVKVLRGEQDVNEPNQVYLKYIVAVSAGWDHLMALEKDDPYHPNLTLTGRVYTWGNNGRGWGGGTAAGWERSVGGKKSSKFSSFGLTWR